MFSKNDISKCYSGMDEAGRLILTPEFRASLARAGHPFPEVRGRALDAADSERDERADFYRTLEALYAKIRHSGRAATSADISAMDEMAPTWDMQEHAAETLARFKRVRGMDGVPDADVRRIFELEQAYARARLESRKQKLGTPTFNGKPLLVMLLLAFFLPVMRAQGPQPIGIFGGTPVIGAACALLPANNVGGAPTAFLNQSGQLFTCKGTPPATTGVWALYGPFDSFQGTGNAVTMNGSDVTLFSFNVPPLATGGCYRLDYEIGAGLSSATIKVKIDGSIISMPFTAASITGVNVSVAGVLYCNNAGTQSSQTLTYTLGVAGWLTFYTPNSGWDYSLGGPPEGDAPISTPAAIDWSQGHVLTITANQASGSVVPGFAHISGGR